MNVTSNGRGAAEAVLQGGCKGVREGACGASSHCEWGLGTLGQELRAAGSYEMHDIACIFLMYRYIYRYVHDLYI